MRSSACRRLTPEQRSALLATNGAARDGLLSYFENQIAAATDESKQKYDYARATTLLAQAQEIFTDSSRVATMKQTLDGRQSDLINRLSRRFDDTLARGWLIDKQNPENASRVLSILAQVQPKHPLLTDKRLLIAYTEQADAALDRSNAALADELIAAGLKIAPQDAGLKDLGDRVRTVTASQQSVQRVRTLRASIDTALGSSPALETFDSKRTELGELRAVAPDDPQLVRWQNQMQTQLDRRLVELTNKRSFTDAETLLGRYAELASTAYVADRRDALTSARKDFTDNLARLGDALQAAIRAGRLGPPAADNAKSIYASLERSGADAEQLAAAKDQISTAYARQAGELRSKGSFADARKLVASGLDFGPSAAVKGVLQDENKEIDDAEKLARSAADQQLRQQLAAQKTKEDNEFKSQLAAALQAPKQSIDSARNALQLAEKLQNRGIRDAMVVNARRDIQNKLLAEIRATSEKSGPDAAIRFAEQASALMPESTVLLGQIVELRKVGAERQAQTRLAAIATIKTEIDALAKTPKLDDKWWRDSQAAFRRLAAYLPDTDPYVMGVKRGMANAYIAAARKSRDAKSLSEADRMIERAAQLAPGASRTRERAQAAGGCARPAGQDGPADQAGRGHGRVEAASARPGEGRRPRIPRDAEEPEADAAGERRVPRLRSALRDRRVVSAHGDQGRAPRIVRRGRDVHRSRPGERFRAPRVAGCAHAVHVAQGSQHGDQQRIESLGARPAYRTGGDPGERSGVVRRRAEALQGGARVAHPRRAGPQRGAGL